MKTHNIVRMFADPDKPRRTIKTGLTLEQAQEHCSRPDTRKEDSNGNMIWFDGYTEVRC